MSEKKEIFETELEENFGCFSPEYWDLIMLRWKSNDQRYHKDL